MAYEIFFQDKTSTIVEAKDGEAIKEILLKSKTPQPLEINGEFYKSNFITSIKHASMPTVDLPNWDAPVLPAGNKPRCRGQYSIHLEIMKIARDEGGARGWGKLLKDRRWVEEQRKQLRTTGAAWCDNRANECACEADFVGTPGRHKVVAI